MITGWWLSPTPLKNDGVSSSVGMMFHSHMESHKSHVNQTTNQIDIVTSRKKKMWPSPALLPQCVFCRRNRSKSWLRKLQDFASVNLSSGWWLTNPSEKYKV